MSHLFIRCQRVRMEIIFTIKRRNYLLPKWKMCKSALASSEKRKSTDLSLERWVFNKRNFEEIFSIVAKEGKEKGMHSKVSYNSAQAVFRISYRIESTKDEVLVEDANEEESE